MTAANILVIEDDEIVARTIERCLRSDEFRVTLVNSGVEGLKAARRNVPNLVILDVIMPGMDGYTVCREMRGDPLLAQVPILFLTAKTKEEDRIAGFIAGADDYLSKPFNLDELILRVRAILRRTRSGPPPQAQTPYSEEPTQPLDPELIAAYQRSLLNKDQPGQTQAANNGAAAPNYLMVVGEYRLDTRTYELDTPHKGRLRLTPVQFDLLYHLMSHPNEIFSPARLLDEVWDYPSDAGSPDLVRVHIKNLRERVEPNPRDPTFIRTVPGYGYTIGHPDHDSSIAA